MLGIFMRRRRWDFFHELLDFIGIEKGRLQFSWISASEGKKFADVVSKVTEDIIAMGPFTDYKKMNAEFTAFFPEEADDAKNIVIKEEEIVL
jgi:F420-non-reducing hydrogenase iron-sulfur subunit